MKYKLLGDKDFNIRVKKAKNKPKRVVPTIKVSVTDTDTGEIIDGCNMDIVKDNEIDCTPFTKMFRPNLFDQLTFPEIRLLCYVIDKMNVYNVVELKATNRELYEYTGFKHRTQLYRALNGLKEMSVIIGKSPGGSAGNWKVCPDCMQKKEKDIRDQDKRSFVKIYEARKLLDLSDVALSVFAYICIKMDFEGCVKMNFSEFQELTGYKRIRLNNGVGKKYKRNENQFYKGKKELKEKDFIRDITTMVDDDSDEKPRPGIWYRVNPNIFIKGKRFDLGYGFE